MIRRQRFVDEPAIEAIIALASDEDEEDGLEIQEEDRSLRQSGGEEDINFVQGRNILVNIKKPSGTSTVLPELGEHAIII